MDVHISRFICREGALIDQSEGIGIGFLLCMQGYTAHKQGDKY